MQRVTSGIQSHQAKEIKPAGPTVHPEQQA
nr:MAG TPA: hypothetical protein [Caudoviricetes sp.]